MSGLEQGEEVKYTPAKVKIIQPSADSPQCWYNDYVGETFEVNKKTWYKDGKVTSESYEMPEPPGGGYNGYLSSDDIEVIK